VGADIDQLSQITTVEQAFQLGEELKALLRRMEKCGKPVVAALNGTTLGGGLELALACHARFAIDDPKAKIGLPEVKLGLLPGGGGTQRLPRLIGIQKSFELITQGTELSPAKAKGLGIVNDLAASREELLQKARDWCLANPKPVQPWDAKGFRIPGGDSKSPSVVQMLAIAPSMANAKAHGNYPAITHIMSCLFEGCLLDIDNALQVESRYFAACIVSQVSKNMIGTLWYQLNAIKKGQSRPANQPQGKVKKVGILGAGMMGAGIAYVSAKAGIDVVLLDTTQENADKGKAYSQGLLDKALSRGKTTQEKRDALLARIQPTTRYEDLQGCDLVVEAVFEDRAIKADCTQRPRRSSVPMRCLPPTPPRCPSPAWRRPAPPCATSSACTSSRPWTRCRWSRSSWARKPRTPRWRAVSTTCCRSARRPSWSTTAGASTPRACSPPT
jgi:3-hydroxyacyl-CoA dehydrogenase/enoyl-CoA hydratase/3-hydroxybutyryl-CoA epimerase